MELDLTMVKIANTDNILVRQYKANEYIKSVRNKRMNRKRKLRKSTALFALSIGFITTLSISSKANSTDFLIRYGTVYNENLLVTEDGNRWNVNTPYVNGTNVSVLFSSELSDYAEDDIILDVFDENITIQNVETSETGYLINFDDGTGFYCEK